jgi:hypothetical protein
MDLEDQPVQHESAESASQLYPLGRGPTRDRAQTNSWGLDWRRGPRRPQARCPQLGRASGPRGRRNRPDPAHDPPALPDRSASLLAEPRAYRRTACLTVANEQGQGQWITARLARETSNPCKADHRW